MGEWARCANCRYIRHQNDARKVQRDTCPKCGAVYDKAENLKEKERRRIFFRNHPNVPTRACTGCREPVFFLASSCPLCEHRLKTPHAVLAAAITCSFALVFATTWFRQGPDLASPFVGISDTHFERCVALSSDWVTVREKEGLASSRTLTAQNEWHALCSRKALRDVRHDPRRALPTSPQEWLYALNE